MVDYGHRQRLRKRAEGYTASHGRGRPTVDAPGLRHDRKLDMLRGMLHGFDYETFAAEPSSARWRANHIAGARRQAKRFCRHRRR